MAKMRCQSLAETINYNSKVYSKGVTLSSRCLGLYFCSHCGPQTTNRSWLGNKKI
jgi:hypothetical protein